MYQGHTIRAGKAPLAGLPATYVEDDREADTVEVVLGDRVSGIEVVASYQLRAAIGELTVQELSLPVSPYEPEAYYLHNRSRLFGLDGAN